MGDMRPWVQSPIELGEFGTQLNAWMSELLTQLDYENVRDNGFPADTGVSTPSIFFDGDANTGFGHLSDQITIVTGGTRRFQVGNTATYSYKPFYKVTEGTAPLVYLGDWTNTAYAGLLTPDFSSRYMIMTDGVDLFLNTDRHMYFRVNNGADSGINLLSNGVVQIPTSEGNSLNVYASWSNYGSPYEAFKYGKDSNGFVVVEGLLRNTSGGTRSPGDPLFLLDAGFRPSSTLIFTCHTVNGPQRIDVDSTGQVRYNGTAGITAGGWVSVSGLVFKAA